MEWVDGNESARAEIDSMRFGIDCTGIGTVASTCTSDGDHTFALLQIAPLAGPMLADLARYAIAAGVTITVGILMGYRPAGGLAGVAAGILLAMITGWCLAWIFMWLGSVTKTAGAVQGMSMMVMFPLAFLSNAFVPVDTLPGWLQVFVSVNPVSHVVSALRDLMNNGTVTIEVGWALLGCAIIAAIFISLAVRSYTKRV